MAQLEEIAESGSPLTAQRLSWKTVAESGSPHSTETPLEEGCGAGSPTRLRDLLEEGSGVRLTHNSSGTQLEEGSWSGFPHMQATVELLDLK